MLHTPLKPLLNQSVLDGRQLPGHRTNSSAAIPIRGSNPAVTMVDPEMDAEAYDDDENSLDGKGGKKSRRELPNGAVATLKAWLLSPEHFTHPYPTPQDQLMLMQKTGVDKKQLKNWFTNARRRIWKPMLKKQIELGKITTTGASVGVHGLVIPTMSSAADPVAAMENPHSIQAIRAHYQQAVLSQQQELPQSQTNAELYRNTVYSDANRDQTSADHYYVSASADSNSNLNYASMIAASNSIGTLPMIPSSVNLSKTDSHAVLMELFARDQDLVRQATESARLKAESRMVAQSMQPLSSSAAVPMQVLSSTAAVPAMPPASSLTEQQQHQQQQPPLPQQQHSSQTPSVHVTKSPNLTSVPSLSSWPHFSSINSLNNLGTIPGVKSITSLSGVDLATKGNLNRLGSLAQIKSMESMGKNDSYAFLEVFFGDRSISNLSVLGGVNGKDGTGRLLFKQSGVSNGGDEDNEIGLSLEDESPSHMALHKREASMQGHSSSTNFSQDSLIDSGTLKRAYDDALAARGLMSVSRSSEKLTDLVLPAKIQRTLSQELINKDTGSQLSLSFMSHAYNYGRPPNRDNATLPPPASSHQPQSVHDNETHAGESVGQAKDSSATSLSSCKLSSMDSQKQPDHSRTNWTTYSSLPTKKQGSL